MLRTERGWAAHFIGAKNCLFRRNTLIESGEKRVVVSTVGNWVDPLSGKAERIGPNSYYETMVFEAIFEEPYWEADLTSEIRVESPTCLDEIGYDSDLKANSMHDAVVTEVMLRMNAVRESAS